MADLTPEERAILETRLTEAEQALHSLTIGTQARVLVDQNGERVEFSGANAVRLRAYIEELKIALGKKTVTGPLKAWMM